MSMEAVLSSLSVEKSSMAISGTPLLIVRDDGADRDFELDVGELENTIIS